MLGAFSSTLSNNFHMDNSKPVETQPSKNGLNGTISLRIIRTSIYTAQGAARYLDKVKLWFIFVVFQAVQIDQTGILLYRTLAYH